MTEFLIAQYDDFFRIQPDPGLKGAWEQIVSLPRADVENLLTSAPSWTAIDERGGVIAMGGVLPIGAMWLLLCYDLRRGQMVPIFRQSKRVVDEFVARTGLNAWANIDESDPNRVRLAKLMGLEKLKDGVWVRYAE